MDVSHTSVERRIRIIRSGANIKDHLQKSKQLHLWVKTEWNLSIPTDRNCLILICFKKNNGLILANELQNEIRYPLYDFTLKPNCSCYSIQSQTVL